MAPVPSAFERNTDKVPSTTQKPWDTLVTSITATAMARPMAPRRALRNHTEWKRKWDRSRWAKTLGVDPSAMPRRRSMTASAPAASRAASATISAAIPSALAWNPGSSDPARFSSSTGTGAAGGALSGVSAVAQGAHITLELRADQLVEAHVRLTHRGDVGPILYRVSFAVADERGGTGGASRPPSP